MAGAVVIGNDSGNADERKRRRICRQVNFHGKYTAAIRHTGIARSEDFCIRGYYDVRIDRLRICGDYAAESQRQQQTGWSSSDAFHKSAF